MFQAGVGDRLPGGGILFCVPDNDGFVVWLQGEHDAANVSALTQMLSQAIASEYQTVIVNLSGVEFMGAATVGVIIAARERLRLSSRNLAIRAPSHCALRILDLCGFSEFLDGEPTEVTHPRDRRGPLQLGSRCRFCRGWIAEMSPRKTPQILPRRLSRQSRNPSFVSRGPPLPGPGDREPCQVSAG